MAIPLSKLDPIALLPSNHLTIDESSLSILDRIFVTEVVDEPPDPGRIGKTIIGFSIAEEFVLNLPGLDGVSLVLGGRDATALKMIVHSMPGEAEVLIIGGARLRFSREWLRPVVKENGVWVDDSSHRYREINIGAGILIKADLTVDFEGQNEFVLSPSMIADTGFVIEGSVAVDLSTNQSLPETIDMGLGESWRGAVFKSLKIHLPDDLDVPILPQDLTLTNFHIGSGGLSGSVSGNWLPAVSGTEITGPGSGTLFGMPFGLKKIQLDLLQNAITEMEINGIVVLPFFDQALGVEIAVGIDGSLGVVLSSEQPSGVVSEAGLVKFEKEGLLKLTVESLGFEVQDGIFTAKLSGQITPDFGDFDWPTFQVEELAIDSEGNVHLEGGWLDLREQYSLNFHGFQMEITKLGFGKTEDGGKWIGFSGGLKLVDGLSAGASVEGLRIIWYDDGDTRLTFNGIGVEFEVPDVLRFKGAVSYTDESKEFAGDIKLNLIALNMQFDGKFVAGRLDGSPYFAIYLGVELPAGIPLGATGLALYGMAGLFALQMEPNKEDHHEWYSIDGQNSWYHKEPEGVAQLSKWQPVADSLAFGAGVTLGTVSDNGHAFSGRMILVFSFPGPIAILEGKANLLKERAKLDGSEPNFRALAVLDNRASTFLVGLDAMYKKDSTGKLIDIRGNAEAFFDFDDASLWHIYLGEREPRDNRIRAEIFQLFEANAYFMLDANQLALGAWVGYDKEWKFGPLRVTVEAWIEGNAVVSWKPTHLHGDLWFHGKAELAVWHFDTGLTVDAQITADVFDPFHVLGDFSVGINLPWPLPDFDADITLEWGPEKIFPPLPLPLKEIAIEHFKVTTSWPLRRGGDQALLVPNYEDENNEGFRDSDEPATIPDTFMPDNMPVVPLDCRPHITFGRCVHDDANVGVNAQPVLPNAKPEPGGWEWVGDPDKNEGPVRVRYGLQEIALYKWNDDGWEPVAWAPNPDAPDAKTKLFGSWAPIPQLPVGEVVPGTDPPVANAKLWLWSKTAFDYTRHTGRAWDEWFTDRFTDYPCVPIPPDQEICCDFEGIDPWQQGHLMKNFY